MNVDDLKEWYISHKKIFFASIELTQNCNFMCRHCYCTGKNTPNLSVEKFKVIIDNIYETGCIYINFTGGEIFAFPGFEDIYLYAKNKGFIINLLSNISLLNDRYLKLMTDLKPNNIAITIYGTNREEYEKFTGDGNNFDKVNVALDKLKKNNIPFTLRTVLNNTCYKSMKENKFFNMANKIGAPFKYTPFIFPKINGDKAPISEQVSVSKIIELEKNNMDVTKQWQAQIKSNEPYSWNCKAGINSFAVDYTGNAYICGLYRKNPISIVDNSIEVVLKHLLKERHKLNDDVMNVKCSACKYRKICKWCPAYSLIYNKNCNSPVDIFCKVSKARWDSFAE